MDPAKYAAEAAQARVLERISSIALGFVYFGSGLSVLALLILLFWLVTGRLDEAGAVSPDNVGTINNVGKLGIMGCALLVMGACWLYIDESSLGYFMIVVAVLLYFAIPFTLTQFKGELSGSNRMVDLAFGQMQNMAWVLFIPGVFLAVFDGVNRGIRRLKYGSELDQVLGLGQDVKQQEVPTARFMGKCWQLPFCRSYVRERCPIYHSRRTCWRERVGCMCEEKAIVTAMMNKAPAADPEMNVRFIPYNRQLSDFEKKERCKECVIYNEHQKQKYQLLAPVTVGSIIGGAYLLHDSLKGSMFKLLQTADNVLAKISLTPGGPAAPTGSTEAVQASIQANEMAAMLLYVCFAVILLSYLLRLVETACFSWKI